MALLIKSINVSIADNYSGSIGMLDKLTFQIAELQCNHIKLGTLEAFLIDFSKVSSVEGLIKPTSFGLVINSNNAFTELVISH
jgi:hypothetical protein